MKITDIENMSAAELKACKAEAVRAVKDDPMLAARYVQARLDATARDEKLAAQAAEIADIKKGLGTEKVALQRQLDAAHNEQLRLESALAAADEVAAELRELRSRAEDE